MSTIFPLPEDSPIYIIYFPLFWTFLSRFSCSDLNFQTSCDLHFYLEPELLPELYHNATEHDDQATLWTGNSFTFRTHMIWWKTTQTFHIRNTGISIHLCTYRLDDFPYIENNPSFFLYAWAQKCLLFMRNILIFMFCFFITYEFPKYIKRWQFFIHFKSFPFLKSYSQPFRGFASKIMYLKNIFYMIFD